VSGHAWRVVCDCGYVVEQLGEGDAIRLAEQHTDDEHAAAIEAG
jgi:hypothetical protein